VPFYSRVVRASAGN